MVGQSQSSQSLGSKLSLSLHFIPTSFDPSKCCHRRGPNRLARLASAHGWLVALFKNPNTLATFCVCTCTRAAGSISSQSLRKSATTLISMLLSCGLSRPTIHAGSSSSANMTETNEACPLLLALTQYLGHSSTAAVIASSARRDPQAHPVCAEWLAAWPIPMAPKWKTSEASRAPPATTALAPSGSFCPHARGEAQPRASGDEHGPQRDEERASVLNLQWRLG